MPDTIPPRATVNEPPEAQALRQQAIAIRDERRAVEDVTQRQAMKYQIYGMTGDWWRIVRRAAHK